MRLVKLDCVADPYTGIRTDKVFTVYLNPESVIHVEESVRPDRKGLVCVTITQYTRHPESGANVCLYVKDSLDQVIRLLQGKAQGQGS